MVKIGAKLPKLFQK